MDSDQGKLFIGGISWETTEEKLKEHFGQYGEVLQAVIMKDKLTGRPRGFGFVAFADPSILDRVLQDKHVIDGRTVDAKRALSREEQQVPARSVDPNAGKNMGGGAGANTRTKKIFVGGLPASLTEDGFRQYFENYGTVTDVVIMFDQSTQRPRGFGFVSFDSEDAVDRVLHKTFHELSNKLVEVKKALPKESNPGSGGSGRSTGAGSYQSYGNSNANLSSHDGRMDANRYMQPPAAGGGYPGYSSSGYGGPGYGYGAAGGGMGYGGYSMSGYGGAAGYGGPSGSYGNPNAPAGSYASIPPGAQGGPWNNQPPSGYASAGYGAKSAYGGGASWSASSTAGANIAAPTGQSPGGTGYGSQGYGYSSYGTNDVSYGVQSGYGGAAGRSGSVGGPAGHAGGNTSENGPGSGYMGSGFADGNAGSGYPYTWKSDASQGGGYGLAQVNGPPNGLAGYSSGYGSNQSRQAQQQ